MPRASYKNEDELRQLLVDNPNILPIEELPGLDTSIQVTVGREAPLGSGYVDVLWIDTEGQLTIVEVKLRKKLPTYYDQAGAIGRRYRRMDEVGTPFCICLDYDTKEDQTVTVRERDSMEQVRMPMDEVAAYIQQRCTYESE